MWNYWEKPGSGSPRVSNKDTDVAASLKSLTEDSQHISGERILLETGMKI